MKTVSLEKAKSAFISGNYLFSKEHLVHLKSQLSSSSSFSPNTSKHLEEIINLISNRKEKDKNKLHEKGLKLLKKIMKNLEKEYPIKSIKDLKYDQIVRREGLIVLLKQEYKLVEQNIFADDLKIYFASEEKTNNNTQINQASKYRDNLKFYSHDYNIVQNTSKHFMAISVDNAGNYNGILSTETSDFNIVKHVDDTHLIYKEEKKYHCSVTPSFIEKHESNILSSYGAFGAATLRESAAQPSKKSVKIWMETAYDVLEYFKKSGSGNPKESMVNYVTTLFNIVKTIYANEQIEILLQGIYVWDIPDPFGARDSGDVLDKYQAYRNLPQNKWEGNLAHLLSFEHGKGSAIAFVDVLCARQYAYGFTWMQKHSSDIQNPSSKNPGTAPITSYSWNSSTIAHELGHNFLLNHTFNCCWYRDGLANQSLGGASYVEGVCKVPPRNLPTGLTIMGYESNYPMTNGFGKQPGDLLRKKISEINCI